MKVSQASSSSTTSFRVRRPSRDGHVSEAVRSPAPMEFLPVVVKPPTLTVAPPAAPSRASSPGFEIILSAGRRVLVPADFEPRALKLLVQALEAVPPC